MITASVMKGLKENVKKYKLSHHSSCSFFLIVNIKEYGIVDRKPHSRIVNVYNLPKRAKNCWAGENTEDLELELACKKDVFLNSLKPTEKHLHWSLFFITLQVLGLQLYYRDTPAQVLSCNFCEIFKNTLFNSTHRGSLWRWT